MEIVTIYKNDLGQDIKIVATSIENDFDYKDKIIHGVRAFCFYGDKLVIVGYGTGWTVPGGGVEKGEDIKDALRREIQEESNMKVLDHRFMFFQTFHKPENRFMYQVLSVCLVEPYGDFVSDPDNDDIEEIKLIDPIDFEKYVDWNDNGSFIKRALEVKLEMEVSGNQV